MSEWAMKRFWKVTEVAETDGGFTVHLDGRGIKTPAKSPLVVPTRAYADLMVTEWAAQEDQVDPNTMPFTKLANSAIDNVAVNFKAVAAMLMDYAGTDLLCYRADGPADLVARQAAAWDPLLAWAKDQFEAPLNVGAGVMFVPQPDDSLARLSAEVQRQTPFQLAALYDLVTIPGSLVIGLAVIHGQATAQDLWSVQRIDEDWQAEQWGVDEEAADLAEVKRAAFERSARAYVALSSR